MMVPSRLVRMNWPALRMRDRRSLMTRCDSGEISVTSSGVSACRVNGGGLTGNGCVG